MAETHKTPDARSYLATLSCRLVWVHVQASMYLRKSKELEQISMAGWQHRVVSYDIYVLLLQA